MKLRERLILLIAPLVLLPLSLVLLFFLFFLEKVAPFQIGIYRTFAFVFVGMLSIIVIAILVGLSNSIVKPVKAVINSARNIAHGDLDHPIQAEKPDDEMGQLISVIEEMKSSLKRQKKIIEESAASSAIGQQAAQVAHDIRAPLASIRSTLEMFSDQIPTEFQQYVQLLSLSTRRIFNIADDLVRKYKGEKENRVLFSLHHVLNNLIKEFSSQQKYSGITFQCHYYSADICLFQERVSIERIFTNIIKNALEAVGFHGSVKVATFLEGEKAVIKVADSGCGIEKDKLPLIFNDRYTSGKEGGTGLGLAYVKRAVENIGGTVAVESKLGEGTVFIFKLPTAKEDFLKNDRSAVLTLAGATTAEILEVEKNKEYKVLVIDDDLVIRMGWELAVKKLGIGSLFAFENLEQLLGHDLDLSAIDLAFVDKNIKGSQFGGADCIGHLRKWGAKKIILASGEDEETLRQDPAFEQADFIISEKIPDSFKAFFS